MSKVRINVMAADDALAYTVDVDAVHTEGAFLMDAVREARYTLDALSEQLDFQAERMMKELRRL